MSDGDRKLGVVWAELCVFKFSFDSVSAARSSRLLEIPQDASVTKVLTPPQHLPRQPP